MGKVPHQQGVLVLGDTLAVPAHGDWSALGGDEPVLEPDAGHGYAVVYVRELLGFNGQW